MKKTKPMSKDDLAYEEEVEEIGLCDYVPDPKGILFTFGNNVEPRDEPMLNLQPGEACPEVKIKATNVLPDNRALKSEPNGITPPIDGEFFLVKRGFAFRRSTIRKLNELKAAHENENAYLSSIVDKALCHYYEYIFKEKHSQT